MGERERAPRRVRWQSAVIPHRLCCETDTRRHGDVSQTFYSTDLFVSGGRLLCVKHMALGQHRSRNTLWDARKSIDILWDESSPLAAQLPCLFALRRESVETQRPCAARRRDKSR